MSIDAHGWTIVGAPWDCSGTGRGEQAAPAALRRAGLAAAIRDDAGDADTRITGTRRDPDTGIRALPETVLAAHALTATLVPLLARDRRPLVIGGDCSILLGIVPALRTIGHIGLWFVDGHPDYVDGAASDTGETADMELALLTGAGPAGWQAIEPADVVLLGHRTVGLDAGAAAELGRLPEGLRRIDAATVAADPAGSGERAAAWLADTGRGAWLHLDLDVLDAGSLPAVTYPQPDGPDWDQLAAALRPMARSPRLIGASVADFRPDLDPDGAYAARIVNLLVHTLP